MLGHACRGVFHARFPMRGFLRGMFILPNDGDPPVAIALVWTMDVPSANSGILNYLLSLVGLPAQLWVFTPQAVIPPTPRWCWSKPGNGRRW